ncbi:hypothetical protein F5Y15DRAFT_379726 [Xylariaceae sp. FL0016]|nr:hypothetical protein F5Y15DRAFT_379726 [Xylariaceae sp. FL0016]
MDTSTQDSALSTRPKRHCWECLRRRLVCDSAQPACNRCQRSRIVCPGYDDRQPLRWVKPGRVTARSRRTRQTRASDVSASTGMSARSPRTQPEWESLDRSQASQAASRPDDTGTNNDAWSRQVGAMERLDYFGQLQERKLDLILRFDLQCEDSVAVQAAYYYNVEVYNYHSPLPKLYDASQVGLPTPVAYAMLPIPLKCLFISCAMIHRIAQITNNTEGGCNREVTIRARSRIAYWNSLALRGLNQDIENEKTRVSDGTITSVLTLLFADQAQSPSRQWRYHYSGLMKMISLRGGLAHLVERSPWQKFGMMGLVFIEVFANTTTPHDDQLTNLSGPGMLETLIELYDQVRVKVYICSICPTQLLFDIIRINHLRAASSQRIIDDSASHEESSGEVAQNLLSSILAFSPEGLADQHSTIPSTRKYWLLVGRIFQSATVLYCILSLQFLSLLPSSSRASLHQDRFLASPNTRTARQLEALEQSHYDRLLTDLKEGLVVREFRGCLMWPLVVAGMRAGRGSHFERAFVEDELMNNSKMGSMLPLFATSVLQRFWKSGKRGWEDCWNEPYSWLS